MQFLRHSNDQCFLCFEDGPLTGEHKIKASQIDREFGAGQTFMFRDGSQTRPRLAQSPKSKVFHYNSKICTKCNSERTQAADRAFDSYHAEILARYEAGTQLSDVAENTVRSVKDRDELDAFRYFAKLLCCFIAEVGGPIPKAVADFAIGRNDRNVILISVGYDARYKEIASTVGELSYAAHGGLGCDFDKRKRYITALSSSLSIGAIKYEYWVSLRLPAKLELSLFHWDFVNWAKEHIVGDET